MTFNLITSPVAKAIVAAIGAGATFIESAVTPHTPVWVIVGAILAVATVFGVYAQENTDEPAPDVPAPVDPGTPAS